MGPEFHSRAIQATTSYYETESSRETPLASSGLKPTTNTNSTEERMALTLPRPSSNYTIDVLSIGSKGRKDLMETQKRTFASHVSVRFFFNATEADDYDPDCSTMLTETQMNEIAHFCRYQRWDHSKNPFMRYMRNHFAKKEWLRKKANPAGWMCAQRRPLHGMYKVLKQYERKGIDLPDHLILMDDDTYFNLEEFHQLYVDNTPHLPLVRAGCLVRLPVHQLNFTFAHGGFGVVFNRAALEKLISPIHCPEQQEVCSRLRENQIGELSQFRNGMSLIELMQGYASHQPYREYNNGKTQVWEHGYSACLHSDWSMGFFVNYYNISRHSILDKKFVDLAEDRLETWLGSGIYKIPQGNCRNENERNCKQNSLTCHYMNADAMERINSQLKQRHPGRYVKGEVSTSI